MCSPLSLCDGYSLASAHCQIPWPLLILPHAVTAAARTADTALRIYFSSLLLLLLLLCCSIAESIEYIVCGEERRREHERKIEPPIAIDHVRR